MARFTAYYKVISRCAVEIEAIDMVAAEEIWNEMDLDVDHAYDVDFDLTEIDLVEA